MAPFWHEAMKLFFFWLVVNVHLRRVQVDDCDQIMMITDAGTLVRTRVSEISIVGRNTQGVILIRTAEDENVVGLQRVAEPVDEEDLDTIDGSAAEGDDEIAPEVDVDDEPEEE